MSVRTVSLSRRCATVAATVCALTGAAAGLTPGAVALAGPAAAASPAAPAASRGHAPVNPRTGLPPGQTPKHTGAAPASAPAGAHLTYYGGPVIPNVKVYQVLYGTGTYTPEVSDTSTTDGTSIASFYTGVTNSGYFDWLNEYNTSTQSIGRGSYAGQLRITPATANNGATVDDTAIQSELVSQINAGHLPMPDQNTLFTLYFRAGQTITQGGSSSGVQFCAYHGTVAATGSIPTFMYSVLPDFTTGGMPSGCGGGTRFANESSVSSHELIEAVTDPQVGLATANAAPLAWYDSVNGEIGDICNAQQGTVTGGDGHSYTVQQEFSNRYNNCIVTAPVAANDFRVAVSPTAMSLAPGTSGSATVTTSTVSGSAQTVSLSVSGAPAGVTASLSPTAVSSGQSATLNISVSSTAAAGSYPLTVTGSAASGTHTATEALTVTGGSTGGGIVNGGFETGTLSGWTASGPTAVVSSGAHFGTYAARVGSTSPSTDASLTQTFTAPTGTSQLGFFYDVVCPDTVTYDWATVTLKDNTSGVTTTPLPKTCVANSGWKSVTAAVTAGHSYTLTLASHDDNYAGDPTYTLYDDVSLSTAPTGSPLTNGGFETGTFSGWTTTGPSESIVTTAHAGSYADRNGSTAATNGDSSTVQTFTAPAGSSKLGFWYEMSCPDTVTYDWATASLKDNTTGTTATVLGHVCASTLAWTQVTASVVAGHSYTLTLTSHDDNYAGDPTYTNFDDVSVS